MNEYVDVKKIVDEMELKEGLCFTALERTYLEIAVLKGAIAMLDSEKEIIKELSQKLNKIHNSKPNWIKKIFKRKNNYVE